MGFLKSIYDKYFPASTLAHRFFWKYRYLFAKNSLTSEEIKKNLDHPHRSEIISELAHFSKINSVLELGSSWGPNLLLISRNNPEINCLGIDISKRKVNIGNKYFQKNNLKNIKLICGDMTSLKKFGENEFDVIISDAALIYVDKKKILNYAEEMVRISRSGLIIVEFDDDSKDPYGHIYQATWIRDYEALFQKYASKIIKRKLNEKIWPGKWSVNGKVITVFLN